MSTGPIMVTPSLGQTALPIESRAGGSPIRKAVTMVLALYFVSGVFAVVCPPHLFGFWMSTATRASVVYLPLAFMVILIFGWYEFPVAAALYFAYIPLAQETSLNTLIAGDPLLSGVPLDAILAVPLVFVGLLGQPGYEPGSGRRLPFGFSAGASIILSAAILSAILAPRKDLAAWGLVGFFVVPIATVLVTLRRLRNIDEYKAVWLGFALAILGISLYKYQQRVVFGDLAGVQAQRWAAMRSSLASPVLLFLAGSLWLAKAKAEIGQIARGIFWGSIALFLTAIVWLQASRAVILPLVLILLLWVPRVVWRSLFRPRVILIILVALAVLCAIIYTTMGTPMDWSLAVERFQRLDLGVTTQARWSIWKTALARWAERPFVGFGVNNFSVVSDRRSPHGAVVGILFDTGLLGALGFGLCFVVLSRLWRKRPIENLSYEQQQFFLGCRAGWLGLLVAVVIKTSFTSGPPMMCIIAYAMYFGALLPMVVYARHTMGANTVEAGQQGTLAGPAPAIGG